MATRKAKVLSLSLAQGVLMLVGIVSGMLLTRVLSIADYGTFLQTFLAYDIAVPLLTLGLPSAMYYFLPGSYERKKGLVLDNLLLLLILGGIFSAFLLLGGAELLSRRFNNPDLERTLGWMIGYPLYTFPTLAAAAVWVTQEKVKLNAIHNVVTGLTLTAAIIISALISRSYEAPTMTRIVLPLIFFPFTLYLIFKTVPGKWDFPSVTSMWSMAKFSIPLGIATVFGTLTRQFSHIIVSSMASPSDFAIYANGAKEVPFISIITGSIAVVIMADMAKYIKEGKYTIALDLFKKSASISASFLFPIMVFLMVFAEDFINILFSSKYADSVIPFRIYLLVIPMRIAFYGSAFIALGKTKSVLIRSLIELVLTAILCYGFVLLFGPNGAALGLVCTLYLWSIPYNLSSLSKSFGTNGLGILPFRILGKTMLISLVCVLIPSCILFIELPSLIRILIASLAFAFIYFFVGSSHLPIFKEAVSEYQTRYLAKFTKMRGNNK